MERVAGRTIPGGEALAAASPGSPEAAPELGPAAPAPKPAPASAMALTMPAAEAPAAPSSESATTASEAGHAASAGSSEPPAAAGSSPREARPLASVRPERGSVDLALAREAAARAGLELRCEGGALVLAGGGMVLRPDFGDLAPRVRPAALSRELLVRAARVRGTVEPWAVDATAGLGEDSFLLAAAGFRVTLLEADPVIAALLADALRRAAADPALAPVAARMELRAADSLAALPALAAAPGARTPDVVYLDPMFPERRKSAAVKKKFQLLHGLERPCADEDALMDAALAARPRKVVVKRPVKGPWLAGRKPAHSLAGKAVRFDVVLP